jgi:hypothetical protein
MEFRDHAPKENDASSVDLYLRLYDPRIHNWVSLPGGLPQFFIMSYPIATVLAVVVRCFMQSGMLQGFVPG